MAGKVLSNTDAILSAVTQYWRELPADLTKVGPFAIIYSDLEDKGVPNNVGLDPWARVTLQITNGKSTSISGRTYRVEGQLFIQIYATSKRSSNADLVKRCAANVAQKISATVIDGVILTDVNAVTGVKEDMFHMAGIRADLFWYERRTSKINPDPPGSSDDDLDNILFDDNLLPVTDDSDGALIGV